ncbi:MAG: DUF881 domain-containing protein, partial [Nocardioidaceae bacterium]
LAALRRPGSRGQVVVAVLLALLGFAAVTQVKSNDKDLSYIGARQGDLVQYINNASLASQRAEAEIARLEQVRRSLGNDTEARRTAMELARNQAETLGILAGTVPATGPGIRVTVTDAGSIGTNQLLNGLQELRDAGAEVIELNDKVRVIAQTSLQDRVEAGVLVDGTLLEPPYVIDAIGDPQTLATALDFRGGFIPEIEDAGGRVSVRRSQDIQVRSVRKPATARYSERAPTG